MQVYSGIALQQNSLPGAWVRSADTYVTSDGEFTLRSVVICSRRPVRRSLSLNIRFTCLPSKGR